MPDDHIIGSGMSEQEMQVASFWVRNRIPLRSLGYGALATLGAICWLFVLWTLLDAYAISYPRESRIPLRILQNSLAVDGLNATAPRPIQPSETTVFEATDGRQDFLVELTNNNPLWWAEFDYRFDASGEQTPMRKGYILPMSKRYLTELGFKAQTRGRTGRLIVENIKWHRVDPAAVDRDYAAYAANRLQFRFDNLSYTRDLTIGTQTVGQSSFVFVNESAYGYWGVDLTVILFRGSTPVGVTTIEKRQVTPGAQMPVSINWFENLAGVSKTEVQANVNILDWSSYLPTSGL